MEAQPRAASASGATRAERPLVALIGNPNTGKTTLFNQLTGARARVGNYPGVTVERRVGTLELDGIVRTFEDNGCPIFNPHRYTLEEGGMKQTDEVQLAFKREADPKGLLNPGKMIAWEDPSYDYRTEKTFLFRGLEKVA